MATTLWDRFHQAVELDVLLGAREIEWVSHPLPASGPPTYNDASAGVAIPSTAVRTFVAVGNGGVSAVPPFGRVWGYVAALNRWFVLNGSEDIFARMEDDGAGRIERLSTAGFSRIYVECGDLAPEVCHIGYSTLED
ncbi:MAG: hypothetical protein ACF8MF_06570 [Phycisphaerales bacterium JB052]